MTRKILAFHKRNPISSNNLNPSIGRLTLMGFRIHTNFQPSWTRNSYFMCFQHLFERLLDFIEKSNILFKKSTVSLFLLQFYYFFNISRVISSINWLYCNKGDKKKLLTDNIYVCTKNKVVFIYRVLICCCFWNYLKWSSYPQVKKNIADQQKIKW
jgi:hypothetical protein